MSSLSSFKKRSLLLAAIVSCGFFGIWHEHRSGVPERPKGEHEPRTERERAVEVQSPETAPNGASRGKLAPDNGDPIPSFDHEFIQVDRTIDEQQTWRGSETLIRRRLIRSPQYPELIYLEEELSKASTGQWMLRKYKLEIAQEWNFKVPREGESLVQQLIAAHHADILADIPQIGLWTLRFDCKTLDSRDVLKTALESMDGFEAVYPSELIWPISTPDDPDYASQWEFAWMEAERAWDITATAAVSDRKHVILAVVDTGVNVEHVEMQAWRNPGEISGNNKDDDGNGQIDDIHGFDFYTQTGNVQRTGGHGVGVAFNAGRLSNNGIEKASLAGSVEVMACVCFSTSGAGSSSAATNSIIYAVDNGARVINCSFVGGSVYSYMYALNYAESHGVIVVAGSGNNGRSIETSPLYPVGSTQPVVVGVGATEADDSLASYSNYGKTRVEVFAPAPSRGTSHATPVASAAISLLIADDPHASALEIIDRLIQGVDKKDDLIGKAVSDGRINIFKSLRLNELRAPNELSAVRLEGETVRLHWNDRSTAELGFIVERSLTDPDTVGDPDDAEQMSWEMLSDSIPANTTVFNDTSEDVGKAWFYRVRAKGMNRNSARNFTTRVLASSEAPESTESLSGRVTDLYARASKGELHLAWFDPGGNETAFVIERKELGMAHFYELARLSAGATAYYDREVEEGVTYVYRLKTLNSAEGAYSHDLTLLAADPPEVPLLIAPAEFHAGETSSDSIELSWVDGSNCAQGFRVYRARADDGEFSLIADLGAEAGQYLDLNLDPETPYRYRVDAFNAFETVPSLELVVSTDPLPPVLGVPELGVTLIDSVSVDFSWVDAESLRHSGYVVEGAVEGGEFALLETLAAEAIGWQYSGLEPQRSYDFRIGSTDGTGVVYSNVVSIQTPPAASILTPPLLTGTILSQHEVALTWLDGSEGETAFLVERSDSQTGPFQTVARLSEDSTQFIDRGLSPGQEAYYRVRVQGTHMWSLTEAISEVILLTAFTVEEQWRLDFFGDAQTSEASAPMADPDGDGWPNLAEFATMHSPLKPQPFLAKAGMTQDMRITLSFQRRLGTGLWFSVEATSDLHQGWHKLAALGPGMSGWQVFHSGIEVIDEINGDGSSRVTLVDSPDHAGALRYLRLVVESEETVAGVRQ